jgi:hypothetical protein
MQHPVLCLRIICFFSFFSYVWSGLIVIVGIYLNVYSRNQTAFNAKITSMANSVFHSRLWPSIIAPPTIRTLSV